MLLAILRRKVSTTVIHVIVSFAFCIHCSYTLCGAIILHTNFNKIHLSNQGEIFEGQLMNLSNTQKPPNSPTLIKDRRFLFP